MTSIHLTSRPTAISAQLYARTAGVLYLINIACGIFGELFVRGKLVVHGDAVATAHHILASESLFRYGIAGDLLMHVTDVPMTVIFYVLLRPVSRDLSALSALFSMLQTAILCANKLNLVAVLLLLGGSTYLNAFAPQQLQALASLSLELHEYGFGIGLVFFGFSCLVAGYLIFRSGYFPKAIGILQALAGVSYLINSFALILNPGFAAKLFPAIVFPAFMAELGTCLYLIVKGMNLARWDERMKIGSLIHSPDQLS